MRKQVSAFVFGALLLPIAASARQAPQLPAGTAMISGRVFAADTGKPIRGATVIAGLAELGGGPAKRAVTDANGHYELTGLGAANYRLTASADHYLPMQFGQVQPGAVGLNARPVALVDAERFDTADFRLSHVSAIEGAVVDEFGDPVPNVTIQVSQIQFSAGKHRLMPTSLNGGSGPMPPTDDKGHFRIFGLAPGEYYVTALSGAFADPNAAGGFGVTFYPGTTSTSTAQPITVAPGHDVTDVQFALVPGTMARVSGVVVDGDGKPVSRGDLRLMPSERSGTSAYMMTRLSSGDDGTFTFRNVPPGAYTIQVFGASLSGEGNVGAFTFGYLTFDVDGHDLDALRVRIPAPRNLRGKITFERDASRLPAPEDVRVFPSQVDFESGPMGGGPPPTKTNDDWTFEVKAMSGLRVVRVSAPDGWLLHRIVRAGVDITDTPLDLRENDVNDVEILLTKMTTTVTGGATLTDGTPASDYSVLIFAEDEAKWTFASRYVQLVRPNQQGTFTIKGMPPGAYLAIAVASLPNGAGQDPDVLKSLRADATRFSLLEAGTATLQLKVKRD